MSGESLRCAIVEAAHHADEEASEAFRDFVGLYDGEGGRLAAEVIARLPANPDAAETYPAIRRLLEE